MFLPVPVLISVVSLRGLSGYGDLLNVDFACMQPKHVLTT